MTKPAVVPVQNQNKDVKAKEVTRIILFKKMLEDNLCSLISLQVSDVSDHFLSFPLFAHED